MKTGLKKFKEIWHSTMDIFEIEEAINKLLAEEKAQNPLQVEHEKKEADAGLIEELGKLCEPDPIMGGLRCIWPNTLKKILSKYKPKESLAESKSIDKDNFKS